jgi:hypothetical protein
MRWSGDDIVRLRQLVADPDVTWTAIPDKMARSADSIRKMCVLLGLREKKISTRPNDGWTPEQLATLRRMWMTHERIEIAQAVGRTMAACSRKANNLRLGPRPVSAARAVAHKAQALEAVRLGREAQAAARAAAPATPPAPRPPPVTAFFVQRSCLCCRKSFKAPTKFIRLCDYCRSNNTGAII